METPDSAPTSERGLLEYASVLIKIVIGITMITGFVPRHMLSQDLHTGPRIVSGESANIVSC